MKPFDALLVAASMAASAGCVREYKPPSASEPHGILKLRRSYEQVGGVSLHEAIDIGEFRALEATSPAGAARAGRTDAILVHPTPAALRVSALFFHTEMRQVQETYTEQVPHMETETYNCGSGFGANATYRTCTRPVTRYKSETKQRWVTRSVEVSDGSCDQTLGIAPLDGRAYLIEYTYQGPGACSVSCFEQTPTGGGQFANRPCPPARLE